MPSKVALTAGAFDAAPIILPMSTPATPHAILPPTDTAHMAQALDLARQALFITSPNPRVGCVIVGTDGAVLGSGHTQRAGQAHAEVMALRK